MKKWIWIGVVAVVAIFFYATYNGFVNREEGLKSAWSNVETQYQRRADLIPNLVNTVKGYAAHETQTLNEVTEARARATSINLSADDLTPERLAQFQRAQAEVRSALGRLIAVSESYPDLKANQNFLELQAQLEGTENRIAVARKDFNAAAQQYNVSVRRFPANLVAKMFGFEQKPYFESAEGSEFTFDLSTAADKDLLLAPAMKVSKSADTKVNLAFKHAMHKLAINYASDGTYTQEQLEAVKTTCTAKSSCEVNMAAATVSKTADKTAAFEAAGKAVRFLLVPQTSEEVTLKIEIGGKTVEHTLAGLNEVLKNATQEIPAALDGGKCLTLNLTFGKDGIVVEGSQIGGWEDQGTVDGDISM